MNILVLTRYGRMGASSRLRFMQYLPGIEAAGHTLEVQSLLDDDWVTAKYRNGRYGFLQLVRAYTRRLQALIKRRNFHLVWIEKEALPWFPAWLERTLLRGVPYVVDYDDAIFHNYDLHPNPWVRRIWGRRIDRLMSGAATVVAGNEYLANRASESGAQRVIVLPTVVDLRRYGMSAELPSGPCRIVWIGSPATVRYLASISVALQRLARKRDFVLRVVGADLEIPGVHIETQRWSEDTEVQQIAGCSVGIMPLDQTPWEQGKCGYKLIQYMACGLPVVASPVGVNRAIVDDGVTGFWANDLIAWERALEDLMDDRQQREWMGQRGHAKVETMYCLAVTLPRLIGILETTVDQKH